MGKRVIYICDKCSEQDVKQDYLYTDEIYISGKERQKLELCNKCHVKFQNYIKEFIDN